jgi:hypothetical protein
MAEPYCGLLSIIDPTHDLYYELIEGNDKVKIKLCMHWSFSSSK